MPNSPTLRVLLIRCGDSACALPLAGLSEVMRPLPLEPSGSAPAFVLGLSLVRGVTVPVVDLAALVTGLPGAPVRRYVTLSVDARPIALAVSEVVGVRELARCEFSALSPLLGESAPFVQALAALDSQLLRVLGDARAVGRELFARLAKHEVSA